MNFDRVEYDHPEGRRILSQEEWSALGPVERVTAIGQSRVRFYRNGVRITAREAVRPQGKAS